MKKWGHENEIRETHREKHLPGASDAVTGNSHELSH